MFQIHYTDGSVSKIYNTTAECVHEVQSIWPDAWCGHDGDLEEGGDRTLVWRNEADSEDDDGAHAVASIRRAK